MNYGVPYKGSKNKIAEWVLDILPKAHTLYDIFAGGCAVTDCAMRHKKYDRYVINDIEGDVTQLYVDALRGKFKNETRWISREDFLTLKDKEAYIRYCWSFGFNGRGYLYSTEIEPYKKACHFAIVFDDFSLIDKLCPEVSGAVKTALDGKTEIKARRMAFGPAVIKKLKELNDWELVLNNPLYKSAKWRGGFIPQNKQGQDLQSLQSLERLERLQRPLRLNTSYDNIRFDDDCVIYCDIPYRNTDQYGKQDFDYEKFYAWALKQTNPVFISEYNMPDDFICIAEKEKSCKMSATKNIKTIEKIFVPKHQYKQ